MEAIQKPGQMIGKQNRLSVFFKKMLNSFVELFKPEEVEVTFKVEGRKISYTYTKVEHKNVA